jgi:hypothetical protein
MHWSKGILAAMESSKQQLLEQLTTSAVELLSKHSVPQSDMYGSIKDALRKHVQGQPPIKVLYNNCYGGYTLSKPFKAFLHDKQDFTTLKEERTRAVQHITTFATSLLDSGICKGLREVLYLYHYHDFGSIVALVRKVINLEHEKLNVLVNIETIRIYLEDPTSSFKEESASTSHLSLWMLKIPSNDNTTYKKYTKQQLQDLLSLYEASDSTKEMIDTLTQATNKLTTLLGQDLYDQIDRFVELEQMNERGNIKYTHSDWWSIDEKNKFKTFMSLLLANGYTNDLVWRYQKFYDKYAMKFLIMAYASQQTNNTSPHEDDTVYDFVFKTHIPLKQDVMDKVEETFGLLCASGACSQLAIATVPPLLEWSVGDYDGLENVYVV